MSKNYYDVLGISKDATDVEIKKAYRELSLKLHPDRNKSENANAEFQEIGEAYETLSDAQKKQQYDAQLNGFGGGGGGGEMNGFNFHFSHSGGMPNDINEIFNMMFNGGGGGTHFFHNGFNLHNMHKPMPIVKNVTLTLEQCYTGLSIPIEIERKVRTTNTIEKETVYIEIPAGIDENEMIVLTNKGHVINDDIRGDVKITIAITKHDLFQRHGLDISLKKTLTLKEALCGFSFEFTHLNGKKLGIQNNVNESRTIISPNYRKVVPNMGLNRNNNTGNMIVEFDVVFPTELTKEQIETLNNTL